VLVLVVLLLIVGVDWYLLSEATVMACVVRVV
jgi:hypothetical protein